MPKLVNCLVADVLSLTIVIEYEALGIAAQHTCAPVLMTRSELFTY
jgi:hypothetical protein